MELDLSPRRAYPIFTRLAKVDCGEEKLVADLGLPGGEKLESVKNSFDPINLQRMESGGGGD